MLILANIPVGENVIQFSYVGYFKKRIKLNFSQSAEVKIEVKLEPQAQQVEDVIVSTTRNYQKAEYLPTQVEVINEDEVEEESHDKPADVSHILREQTGVQVQRTSAIQGTLGIRLQGLSSDYTQILKDGFPIFSGLSNVIGITQIPPLDLKQGEIIRGPCSTVYGSDAIAGVINLVSKIPTQEPVNDLMLNWETAAAFDGGFYASQKFKWFSFALMGAYRYQKQKDWGGQDFTETPLLHRYTISPQFYFDISKHVSLNVGGNYTNENRTGGTDKYFNGTADTSNNYYENNVTEHAGANLKLQCDFGGKGALTLKSAANYLNRDLTLPFYLFRGTQLASASEINYRVAIKKHDLVLGFDLRTDEFKEGADSSAVRRNYNFQTFGFFAQYIYHFNEKTTAEVGLRGDYNNVYKVFVLPHGAILQRWNGTYSRHEAKM